MPTPNLKKWLHFQLYWRDPNADPPYKAIQGPHSNLQNAGNLHGDCSAIYGDAADLFGSVINRLEGDVTGIYGDCSSIEGDIDSCGLTEQEREAGVQIQDLVGTEY